jgi:hypothetical protein
LDDVEALAARPRATKHCNDIGQLVRELCRLPESASRSHKRELPNFGPLHSARAVKRHPALASLSRDHHHALVIALRLRRASEETAGAAARAFVSHWDSEEKLHFRLEEEVLLPAYATYGDPANPVIVRMLVDHMLIRRDASRLALTPSQDLVNELGVRLADHVRLEEDEVFPLIEATLPELDLRALGDRMRESRVT